MGADFKDVFNDGRPDIWHTAVENDPSRYFKMSGVASSSRRPPKRTSHQRAVCRDGETEYSISITTAGRTFSLREVTMFSTIIAQFSNRLYEEPNSGCFAILEMASSRM